MSWAVLVRSCRSNVEDCYVLLCYVLLLLYSVVLERLSFSRDISLENSADSYLCFQLALLQSVLHFFFLYQSPFSTLCRVFKSISTNMDLILSINPSANVFVFQDFNIHHKDWIAYSGATD